MWPNITDPIYECILGEYGNGLSKIIAAWTTPSNVDIHLLCTTWMGTSCTLLKDTQTHSHRSNGRE